MQQSTCTINKAIILNHHTKTVFQPNLQQTFSLTTSTQDNSKTIYEELHVQMYMYFLDRFLNVRKETARDEELHVQMYMYFLDRFLNVRKETARDVWKYNAQH